MQGNRKIEYFYFLGVQQKSKTQQICKMYIKYLY